MLSIGGQLRHVAEASNVAEGSGSHTCPRVAHGGYGGACGMMG